MWRFKLPKEWKLPNLKGRLPSLPPEVAGIGVALAANGVIIVVATIAAIFNFAIPLVVNSPSRYSVLVVPVALAAVVAALVSFVQYLRGAPLITLFGMFVAGLVVTQFFIAFPENRGTLIHDYLERLDFIGLGILAFSLLALIGSIWMCFRVPGEPAPKGSKAPEHQKEFWLIKGFVCDLPIVIGAALLFCVQATSLEVSHQQYTEILFDLMGGDRKTEASPEFFQAEELQRQLGIANFWIGVSLGVTSAQLVAQQLGTLMLEWIFWSRKSV